MIKCKIKSCSCYGWSKTMCWRCGKDLGMGHIIDDDGVSNYCNECFEVKNV